jgi:hypothetical protein
MYLYLFISECTGIQTVVTLFKQSEHVQSRRFTNVTSEIMSQSRGHCRVFNLDLNFVNTVLSRSSDFDFLIDEHLFGSCSSPRVGAPYSCFSCDHIKCVELRRQRKIMCFLCRVV